MKNIQKFYDKKQHQYNEKLIAGSLYDKVHQLVPPGQRVLEIGCANGNFGKELKRKGCKVYGVEVSSDMARQAKRHLDSVVVGNIEDMPLRWERNYFDVILLMDVLEHLFDPTATLMKVKKHLKSGGVIIVTLPNVANWKIRWDLLFGRFEYDSSDLLEKGHIRFFTFSTAQKMFLDAGYRVEQSDLMITTPSLLGKISNRFHFLRLEEVFKRKFSTIFGYQFIFLLRKNK